MSVRKPPICRCVTDRAASVAVFQMTHLYCLPNSKEASTERRTHHRALEREKGVIWDQAELIELHLTQQAHGSHAHAGTGTWKAPCCLNSEHADTSIHSTASVSALIRSLHLWDACYCATDYQMIRRSSGFIFLHIFTYTSTDDYASVLIKGTSKEQPCSPPLCTTDYMNMKKNSWKLKTEWSRR